VLTQFSSAASTSGISPGQPGHAQRLIIAVSNLFSDLPLTSPHRDTWPSPTIADTLSTSMSRPRQRNSKILSETLLCLCRSEQNVFYAECSRQVFNLTVYGQVGKVVLKVIESTQCQRRGTIMAVNVAYICCCRRQTDTQQSTFL